MFINWMTCQRWWPFQSPESYDYNPALLYQTDLLYELKDILKSSIGVYIQGGGSGTMCDINGLNVEIDITIK